jgi:protein disulfide-isomerase
LLACCALLKVNAADLNWLTDVTKAEAQAKTDNKLVLLDFTGSDWCGWCMKLDKETFSKTEFTDYASKNLVLVQLDYPNKKPQSDDLKKANAALQTKYSIEGFPTLIALKPDGTVVWKQVGYLAGGPKALIAKLDEAKNK